MATSPWWLWALSALTLGAILSLGVYSLIHECTHDLVTPWPVANQIIATVANTAHVVPSALTFRTLHLTHHAHQGEYDRDADLPYLWEVRLFGSSFFGKLAWFALYPILLAIRTPRIARRGGVRVVTAAGLLNVAFVLAFDVLWVVLFGPWALGWLLLAFYASVGPTPLGARWIQEHFVLRDLQETNTYRGPVNLTCMNIGMHNEHNDFPGVPWFRLPRVREEAAEFYSNLYEVHSYTGLFLRFLTDRSLSLGSRVVREGQPAPKVRAEDELQAAE